MTTDHAGTGDHRGDLPAPDQRTTLNAALTATGAETGFWDEHGTPAPWPDDIDGWRPVTNPPSPF